MTAGLALMSAADFAYVSVPNAHQVSVIDPATNSVTATIPFPSAPVALAIAPGGRKAYVALTEIPSIRGQLAIVDLTTQSMVDSIPLPYSVWAIALHPSGNPVWIIPEDGSNTVVPIDLSTKTIGPAISVGEGPLGIALAPDGQRAYVASQTSGTVSVIDTNSGSVIATIPVGTSPSYVAVNPLGTEVWVAIQGGFGAARLSVIDVSTNMILATMPIPNAPTGLAFNTFGTRLYVAHGGSWDGISVVNPRTRSVIASIPSGTQTFSVAVSPDDRHVFADNFMANSVWILDAATNTLSGTVGLPDYSLNLATAPNTGALYQAESPANTLSGKARVETCSTCSGGAQVTHLGSDESGAITFSGVAGNARTYSLEIDYINGSNASRTLSLSVNDGPATSMVFPNTGNWNDAPGSIVVNIQLEEGSNTLRFFNTRSPGPNLDRIVLR